MQNTSQDHDYAMYLRNFEVSQSHAALFYSNLYYTLNQITGEPYFQENLNKSYENGKKNDFNAFKRATTDKHGLNSDFAIKQEHEFNVNNEGNTFYRGIYDLNITNNNYTMFREDLNTPIKVEENDAYGDKKYINNFFDKATPDEEGNECRNMRNDLNKSIKIEDNYENRDAYFINNNNYEAYKSREFTDSILNKAIKSEGNNESSYHAFNKAIRNKENYECTSTNYTNNNLIKALPIDANDEFRNNNINCAITVEQDELHKHYLNKAIKIEQTYECSYNDLNKPNENEENNKYSDNIGMSKTIKTKRNHESGYNAFNKAIQIEENHEYKGTNYTNTNLNLAIQIEAKDEVTDINLNRVSKVEQEELHSEIYIKEELQDDLNEYEALERGSLNLKGEEIDQQKRFVCDKCGKAYSRKSVLILHDRIHTNYKPYKCDKCDKSFSRKEHLVVHDRTHTGYKPFKCDICEKSFSQNETLKTHYRIHTGDKPFKCIQCEKSFNQISNLKAHYVIHTDDRPYKCDKCDKSFKQKEHLRSHNSIHSLLKPFTCEKCGKCFTLKSSLRIHDRIHTGIKPYVCQICERAFTQNSALKAHQKMHIKFEFVDLSQQEILNTNVSF